MRYLRSAIVAAIATAALVVPSAALAQIGSLSISGKGVLSAERDSATVTMNFRCRPRFNVAFGEATLAQSTGGKLARGSGE